MVSYHWLWKTTRSGDLRYLRFATLSLFSLHITKNKVVLVLDRSALLLVPLYLLLRTLFSFDVNFPSSNMLMEDIHQGCHWIGREPRRISCRQKPCCVALHSSVASRLFRLRAMHVQQVGYQELSRSKLKPFFLFCKSLTPSFVLIRPTCPTTRL